MEPSPPSPPLYGGRTTFDDCFWSPPRAAFCPRMWM
jgi:hypothetical protein